MTANQISLRIPDSLATLLRAQAAKRKTTVQAEILRLLGLQLRVSVPTPKRGRPAISRIK